MIQSNASSDILWRWIFSFAIVFICSFQFNYTILPDPYMWFGFLFKKLAFVEGNIIGVEFLDNQLSSDSYGLYLAAVNAVLFASIATFVWRKIKPTISIKTVCWMRTCLVYYLALQLLKYGFDKVFKAQFYDAEPNILYTRVGNLSKDILYWTSIGSSYMYNLFLGAVEVLAALCLLSRKFRLLGLFLCVGVFVNVVAVNFSFNISVKLYSVFLLCISLVSLIPYRNRLKAIISLEALEVLPIYSPTVNKKIRIVKVIIVIVFLSEALFPFFMSGKWNDDSFKRPLYHGAYAVTDVNPFDIKRVHIHRRGYLIFENDNNEFQDFQMEINSKLGIIRLTDYQTNEVFNLEFLSKKHMLSQLKGELFRQKITFNLKPLAIDGLPLNQDGFNWTIDH